MKRILSASAASHCALAGMAACGVLILSAHAMAAEKRAAAAPVIRPAGAQAGGGAHLPGNLGGGAHLPGSMGGGAHIPGSMAGGMGGGAHIPGRMASGAHMPGTMAREPSSPRQPSAVEHAATEHPTHAYGGTGSVHATHAGFSRPTQSHPTGESRGREAAAGAGLRDERHALHGDPRIGGAAALHTRGLMAGGAVGAGAGLAAHHMAASYMSRPAGRDIAHDRAFASAHAGDFHARYVHDFTPAEFARWQGGAWSAGWHFGRFGWWWDVDGVWYPYAAPIYPYPLEVAALTVYGDDYRDPGLPVEQDASIAPLPAGPAGLYSCVSPQGFYPAVSACSQPWQIASAAPDQAPPPAVTSQ